MERRAPDIAGSVKTSKIGPAPDFEVTDDGMKPVRAWKVKGAHLRPDHEAGLVTWLVNGPFHPAWQWWMVGLVHLRPIEGQSKEPHKQYPEAEYEFLIYSIDPEKCPEPDPDNPGDGYPNLRPIDVCEQFHGVTDDQAIQVVEMCVRAICEGVLSPDQDYRAAWRRSLTATVDHYRRGIH